MFLKKEHGFKITMLFFQNEYTANRPSAILDLLLRLD